MDKQYLIEIYKTEAEKYNKTRDIHWKMNIAIWTLLIVVIYAKSQNKLPIGNIYIEIAASFVYLMIHYFFVREIHGSLYRSLTRMHNMASSLLKENEETSKWKDFDKKVSMKTGLWEYLQLGITIFLIIIFLLIKHSDEILK